MRDKRKMAGIPSGATTLVAEGTQVLGEIRFHGNLEIEGVVTGNIIAEDPENARVRILQSGQVHGEVHAPEVVVNGLIEGDLFVSKHLELVSKAVVQGNVHYDSIEIEKGAQVNGSFVRNAAAAKSVDKLRAVDGSEVATA